MNKNLPTWESNPALVQEATKDCLKSKIHPESPEMGFHGRLAHFCTAATRGLVNPLDVKTSESFDWIVPPRGRNNERGQLLTSKIRPQKPRSRSQLILTQSRLRLIPASSRRAGTGAIQSQHSLESFHLFSLHDRGGHITTWLPLNYPDSKVCSFLLRL